MLKPSWLVAYLMTTLYFRARHTACATSRDNVEFTAVDLTPPRFLIWVQSEALKKVQRTTRDLTDTKKPSFLQTLWLIVVRPVCLHALVLVSIYPFLCRICTSFSTVL
jgi:hypothetical protein